MVSSNMPAFSAYASTSQTVSANTSTKAVFDTKLFDTASCYNNTSATVGSIPAYSFLPNVAGYYLVGTELGVNGNTALVELYKNGFTFTRIAQSLTGCQAIGSYLIYLNGTTDYISIYISTPGTSLFNGQALSNFWVTLVRAA
jgi:hypothetical protein